MGDTLMEQADAGTLGGVAATAQEQGLKTSAAEPELRSPADIFARMSGVEAALGARLGGEGSSSGGRSTAPATSASAKSFEEFAAATQQPRGEAATARAVPVGCTDSAS